MKSIRITSDGTRFGTKVVDEATGEPLQGVKDVTLQLGDDEDGKLVTVAVVTFHMPKVDGVWPMVDA